MKCGGPEYECGDLSCEHHADCYKGLDACYHGLQECRTHVLQEPRREALRRRHAYQTVAMRLVASMGTYELWSACTGSLAFTTTEEELEAAYGEEGAALVKAAFYRAARERLEHASTGEAP